MYEPLVLSVPGNDIELRIGNKIKLGRFETKVWEVSYGWYAWAGNRPVCGWYITESTKPSNLKPLHLSDLDDIIFIET